MGQKSPKKRRQRSLTCPIFPYFSGKYERYALLEEKAADKEQLRLIVRELARLSSNYRRVTVEYYIDGRSVGEIAKHLSLTESMVKYLLFQSRKHIKEGIVMEKEYGRLSYDPVELTLFFWGGRNVYHEIFDGNKLRQNIVILTKKELPALYTLSEAEVIMQNLCGPFFLRERHRPKIQKNNAFFDMI